MSKQTKTVDVFTCDRCHEPIPEGKRSHFPEGTFFFNWGGDGPMPRAEDWCARCLRIVTRAAEKAASPPKKREVEGPGSYDVK